MKYFLLFKIFSFSNNWHITIFISLKLLEMEKNACINQHLIAFRYSNSDYSSFDTFLCFNFLLYSNWLVGCSYRENRASRTFDIINSISNLGSISWVVLSYGRTIRKNGGYFEENSYLNHLHWQRTIVKLYTFILFVGVWERKFIFK